MESRIDHYVEIKYNQKKWDGKDSYSIKINSKIEFLEDNMENFKKGMFNSGFRFYDIETIYLDEKEYSSKPMNYSQWINKYIYYYGTLDDDSIDAIDYYDELKNKSVKQLCLFK